MDQSCNLILTGSVHYTKWFDFILKLTPKALNLMLTGRYSNLSLSPDITRILIG